MDPSRTIARIASSHVHHGALVLLRRGPRERGDRCAIGGVVTRGGT